MVHQLLAQMENGYMKIIKENLVGIYLHGSYAFGTYCHSVSDLDVLIVVYEKLTIDEKKQLLDYTINILDKWAPKRDRIPCATIKRYNKFELSDSLRFTFFSDTSFQISD